MTRLLLCSMSVPWPDRPGLCAYHVAQANALRELGVEMELLSPAPALPRWSGSVSPKCRAHLARPLRYQMNGVAISSPRCPFAFPRTFRFGVAPVAPGAVARAAELGLHRAVRERVRRFRPDALLAHGIMPWGRVVLRVARETGVPLAFLEHSAEDVLRLRSGSRLGTFYRRCAAGACAVLAVGRPMVRHLREELGLKNVLYLPNGARLPADPGRLSARPSSLQNRMLLLSAGHYAPRKGFELLVDSFAALTARHPRAVLRIVTNAPPSLLRRIESLDLGDRIRVMPPMEQACLQRWMSWSDLFVLASWYEAFALVGIEAMAASTPVVLTRECGLSAMINPVGTDGPGESHHGWIVEPRRLDSLTKALDEALSHKRMLPRLGEAGRELVTSTFTWHRNARIILDALDQKRALRWCA